MFTEISCPHCGQNLKFSDEHYGKKLQCPHCRNTFRMQAPVREVPAASQWEGAGPGPAAGRGAGAGAVRPMPPPTDASRPLPGYHRGRPASRAAGANVSLILTGAAAVAVTVVFYLAMMPVQNTYVGRLFVHRGWVPYVIVLLAAWAAAILIQKYRKLAVQKRSLLFDVLPASLSREIRQDNVTLFQNHVSSLPCEPRSNFLVNRILRALDHFRSRGNVQEVTTLLSSQAEIDLATVESSYTMLDVFIWAIPILGFIGTVLGIGSAVGGFSQSIEAAQELNIIKDSLGTVTTGLAVAFDTTLLALVMSVFIMFPARSLQKGEEDLLNHIEDYCSENLVRRLDDRGASMTSDAETIRRVVSDVMSEHMEGLERLSDHIESAGRQVTERVVAGWRGVHEELQHSHARQVEAVRGVLHEASREKSDFLAETRAVQDAQTRKLSEAVAAMAETARRTQEEIASLQNRMVDELRGTVSSVSGGLNDLRVQANREHQAEAESLREMAKRFAESLDDLSRQAGEAQARQLDGLASVGSGIVASLTDCQEKLARQVDALTAMLHEHGKLAEMQQALAANLELLAASGSFRETLSGIDQGLGRLGPVLEDLGQWVKSPPAARVVEDKPHARRGIWRWFRKGNGNG